MAKRPPRLDPRPPKLHWLWIDGAVVALQTGPTGLCPPPPLHHDPPARRLAPHHLSHHVPGQPQDEPAFAATCDPSLRPAGHKVAASELTTSAYNQQNTLEYTWSLGQIQAQNKISKTGQVSKALKLIGEGFQIQEDPLCLGNPPSPKPLFFTQL